MERLSSFVLAYRRWVFAFWIVMFVAGMAAPAGKPHTPSLRKINVVPRARRGNGRPLQCGSVRRGDRGR